MFWLRRRHQNTDAVVLDLPPPLRNVVRLSRQGAPQQHNARASKPVETFALWDALTPSRNATAKSIERLCRFFLTRVGPFTGACPFTVPHLYSEHRSALASTRNPRNPRAESKETSCVFQAARASSSSSMIPRDEVPSRSHKQRALGHLFTILHTPAGSCQVLDAALESPPLTESLPSPSTFPSHTAAARSRALESRPSEP